MHATPSLEKAESYVNLQLSRSATLSPTQPPEPFVTLSREAGAGASTLARSLADQLNAELAPDQTPWTVFDGNIVEAMLTAHRYSPALAKFLPEDAVSEVTASVGELVGLHPNLWDLNQKTHALIRRLAAHGHCILIGRGANFATADLPGGVHVRLIGSPARRAEHMAKLLGIDLQQATARNLRADIARRRYVQTAFNREVDDPSAYDLVINTDHLPPAEAAAVVLRLVHTRQPPSPGSTRPTSTLSSH